MAGMQHSVIGLLCTHALRSTSWVALQLLEVSRRFCCRRDADTQKLSQNILAANDQRLMAINMHLQQLQRQEDARASQSLAALGCGKAPSAAEVIKSSMFASRIATGQGNSAPAWDSEDGSMPKGGGELRDVPFEMLVLEVLLDATTGLLQ
eukprot:GHUV01029089.1.p1 GENE.GHUV01029089.1~~GHUV01029089.1.p1  ORF type:complete len:151 (-),score=11.86 GHUV01029089.1:416-868(-)